MNGCHVIGPAYRKIEAQVRAKCGVPPRQLREALAENAAASRERRLEVKCKLLSRRIWRMRSDGGQINGHDILRQVALQNNLTVAQLTSASRRQFIVIPRHEAIYRMSKETRLATSQIARIMGGKDHTTVLHAIAAYRKRNGLAA